MKQQGKMSKGKNYIYIYFIFNMLPQIPIYTKFFFFFLVHMILFSSNIPFENSYICKGILENFPRASDGRESVCNAGDLNLILGLVRFPWRREWQPTLVLLLGELRGQRTFEVFSPWCRKESDTIEELNTLTFLENLA